MFNIHTKESLTVTFKKDGHYVPEALKQLNEFMRDWRRNESRDMDPELIDLIWTLHQQLGSTVPVNLVCGYRSATTNESLRRAGGGQAKASQHILGKAADIVFPDVSGEDLAQFGADRGMGWRRLLPDLGRTLRACRYRARAHVAAPSAPRACRLVPQRTVEISADRRQADHTGRL